MSSTKSSGVKTARWFVTLIENIDIWQFVQEVYI